MKFKTPEFWYTDNTPARLKKWALTPLSWFYQAGSCLHHAITIAKKAPLPVICVGNLNAGGAGKTPCALALMKTIRDHSLINNPFFLTRGYGGAHQGPLEVLPEKHSPAETGDEALLLASHAPTILAAKRIDGATLAHKCGAGAVIMDDGLQHSGLQKNLNFVVIDGSMGFGNDHCLPAGPLRESVHSGFQKAHAFILIGADKRNIAALLPPEKPVFKASLKVPANYKPDPKKPYLAFSGLGWPDKFFDFLKEELSLNLAGTQKFPDHHPYTQDDLARLLEKTRALNATLITTEKDALRLPARKDIITLPVNLVWENEAALVNFLKNKPGLH